MYIYIYMSRWGSDPQGKHKTRVRKLIVAGGQFPNSCKSNKINKNSSHKYGQIIPTPQESILHPSRTSHWTQVPYNTNILLFLSAGFESCLVIPLHIPYPAVGVVYFLSIIWTSAGNTTIHNLNFDRGLQVRS